jgi:hypothetical protein
MGKRMLTSDQDPKVVDGARYELVLTSPGEEPITLHLSSESLAKMIQVWTEVQRHKGTRLDADAFFRELMWQTLRSCQREPSTDEVLNVTPVP